MVAWVVALFPRVWGTVEMCMRRELKMQARKMASDIKYHGIIWHTFVEPNFAMPNFAFLCLFLIIAVEVGIHPLDPLGPIRLFCANANSYKCP